MKKFLLLLFLCSMTAYAQNEKVNIDLIQGADKAYSIIDVQEIQFFGGGVYKTQLKVVFKNGEPVVFPIENINKVTFTPPGLNIPIRLFTDGETTPEMILTTTFDYIAFNYVDTTSGVVDEISASGDLAFTNNYPNPFNETTAIEFELKNTGIARAEILDIHGEQVAELKNEYLESGVHKLLWDGKDNSGKTITSGVYICRVQAGASVIMKKIMAAK